MTVMLAIVATVLMASLSHQAMGLILDGLGVGAGRDAGEYDSKPIAALLPTTAPKREPTPAERLDRFIDERMKLDAVAHADTPKALGMAMTRHGLRSIKRGGCRNYEGIVLRSLGFPPNRGGGRKAGASSEKEGEA